MTGDIFAKRQNVKINRARFSALTVVAVLSEKKVLLLKPQTYMNLSGDALKQAVKFYKVPIGNVIVVSDDVALPIGKLRIRRSGSAGGHNGLKDIISKCGGEDFPRVRIGVGAPPHTEYDMRDWVLSKLSDEDYSIVSKAALQAAIAVETIITQGIDFAISKLPEVIS